MKKQTKNKANKQKTTTQIKQNKTINTPTTTTTTTTTTTNNKQQQQTKRNILCAVCEPSWPSGKATVKLVSRRTWVRFLFGSLQTLWSVDTVFVTLPLTMNGTLKQLSSLPILMQNHSGVESIALDIVSLFPPPSRISAPASTSSGK